MQIRSINCYYPLIIIEIRLSHLYMYIIVSGHLSSTSGREQYEKTSQPNLDRAMGGMKESDANAIPAIDITHASALWYQPPAVAGNRASAPQG